MDDLWSDDDEDELVLPIPGAFPRDIERKRKRSLEDIGTCFANEAFFFPPKVATIKKAARPSHLLNLS